MCSQSSFGWVSPFRNRRIKGYLLLPGAYRSLSRLSSALSAKASTICSFMLDQIDLCRFITQTLAPSVVLIWFRFYILNCFVVYRNHLVLILGYWLLQSVSLGCLDISSDIQCAVFKEQLDKSKAFILTVLSSHQVRKAFIRILIGAFSYLIAVQRNIKLFYINPAATYFAIPLPV